MKALITGASSGIGRDMSRYLSELGYDLVIVARRKELLEELKTELRTEVKIECVDISNKENCIELFERNKAEAKARYDYLKKLVTLYETE